MECIEAYLLSDIGENEQRKGETAGKSNEIDGGVRLVLDNITPGGTKEIGDHGFGLRIRYVYAEIPP